MGKRRAEKLHHECELVMVGERVLVVDDDPAIRNLVATILRREKFHIETATDGEDALEKISAQPFRLVILDLMMPRKNGFEVIDYLKEHRTTIDQPVLVMTAATDKFVGKVDMDFVKGVVRKPFDITELTKLVRALIHQSLKTGSPAWP